MKFTIIGMLGISALFFAYLATYAVLQILPRFSVLDHPSERSNHTQPTPRGGGLAIVFAAFGFMFVAGFKTQLLLVGLFLAGVSFMDDVRGLSAAKRLAVHFVVALYASSVMDGLAFQGLLPYWADRVLLAVLWTGYINIFNFMDGIDEISSVQTFSLCAGILALFTTAAHLPDFLPLDATVLACAVAGFWVFNRHPAKIFLGDVGSVTLGFLTGYMLIHLAQRGEWAAALILPAYYMVDGGVTLVLRALKGKRIWESHSEHAYQRAARAWGSHPEVVSYILALNMLLIVLACVSSISADYHWMAVEGAYFIAIVWWLALRNAKRRLHADIIPPVMQAVRAG
jgi:UDP-N-acetylmuramyl pentapeptide phosphotransferase/UDP-N-acetylglucosamine-1-phosphate transferase